MVVGYVVMVCEIVKVVGIMIVLVGWLSVVSDGLVVVGVCFGLFSLLFMSVII